jgi:hypothetical protein
MSLEAETRRTMGTAGAWQIVPSQILKTTTTTTDSSEANSLKRSAEDVATDEDSGQFKLRKKVLDAGRLARSYDPDSAPIKLRVKPEADALTERDSQNMINSSRPVSPTFMENKYSELEMNKSDSMKQCQTLAVFAGADGVKGKMGNMDGTSSSLPAVDLPELSKSPQTMRGKGLQTYEGQEEQVGDTTKTILFRKRRGPSRGK